MTRPIPRHAHLPTTPIAVREVTAGELAERRASRLVDALAADEALAVREPGSVTFRCVADRKRESGALPFFYAKRRLMQGPHAAQPRTYRTREGVEVTVSVEGGKGGDIHGTLATLEDIDRAIGRAVRELERRQVRGGRPASIPTGSVRWVLDAYYGGLDDEPAPGWTPGGDRPLAWTQAEIADRLRVAQQAVSAMIGRVEGAIANELRAAGIVR